jgi:hypothetical protein
MSFSIYTDSWTSSNHTNFHAVSTGYDNSWGCNHWDYSINLTIYGPSYWSNSSSGSSVGHSVPNYAGGDYDIFSTFNLYCDCIYIYWAFAGFTEDTAQPQCGDARGVMMQEYIDYSVGWIPSCGDFASSGASSYFSWSELNGGFSDGNPHSPWGIVTGTLKSKLDATRSTFGGPIVLSSGYRLSARQLRRRRREQQLSHARPLM